MEDMVTAGARSIPNTPPLEECQGTIGCREPGRAETEVAVVLNDVWRLSCCKNSPTSEEKSSD